jgi:hypothetical protein
VPKIPECNKKNEMLNSCPRYCTFEPTCATEIQGLIRECLPNPPENWRCQPRCECKQGFVRIDGQCVVVGKCCKKNEKVVRCPAPEEKTCNGKPPKVKRKCLKKTCICVDGFLRNDKGECVSKKECGWCFCSFLVHIVLIMFILNLPEPEIKKKCDDISTVEVIKKTSGKTEKKNESHESNSKNESSKNSTSKIAQTKCVDVVTVESPIVVEEPAVKGNECK